MYLSVNNRINNNNNKIIISQNSNLIFTLINPCHSRTDSQTLMVMMMMIMMMMIIMMMMMMRGSKMITNIAMIAMIIVPMFHS